MPWSIRRAMLLGSTAYFAPPNEGGSGGGGDDTLLDDELLLDDDPPPADDDPPPADGEDPPPADDDPPPADGEDPPPRQESRAERRIRTLQEARVAADNRAADAERRLAERDRAPVVPQETPDQERERLALMTPEEQVDYKVNKALRASNQMMQNVAFRVEDTADKADYDRRAETDKRYARYSDVVEKKLQEVRAKGQNIQRTALLYYIIGERVVKGGPAAARPQQRAAANRVQRQQAGNGGIRSDARNDSRRRGDTPAKRLEGVQI